MSCCNSTTKCICFMFFLHCSYLLQPSPLTWILRITMADAENTAADVPIEAPARPTKKRSLSSAQWADLKTPQLEVISGCRIKKKLFKDQKKNLLEGINHKFFRDQKKITPHENSTGSVSLRSWPDQKKIIRPGSLAKYDMKNCTQFWPGAHSVKMYETHRNTPCSDHCVAGFSCC